MVLRQPRPKITLSLTPLIDVVFILLVFFMLASQFADWRQLDLVPQAQVPGAMADEKTSLLTLRNDGTFMLDGEGVAHLQTILARLKSVAKSEAVFVAPEVVVGIQHVVDVVEGLNAAGFAKVQLAEMPGGSRP